MQNFVSPRRTKKKVGSLVAGEENADLSRHYDHEKEPQGLVLEFP